MLHLSRLSRFDAAAIHLAISSFIAVAAMILMLALWYPPPLFGAMGGKELIILIVGVDVMIGPLMTLIVFDTRKKDLPFDLAMIAALQLSALCYGAYAMHEGRPAFIVFAEDRFIVVSAAEIEREALAKARPEFQKLPETGPVVVAADLPDDPKERMTLFFVGLAGVGVQNLPYRYVPYLERSDKVLAAARPLARLEDLNPEARSELDGAIARAGRSRENLRFLSVRAGRSILTGLIDGKSGELLAIVAANPASRSQGRRPLLPS